VSSPTLTPAAQYLRTSTQQQPYSIETQKEAIADYAYRKGLVITRTYVDEGRSGLTLAARRGFTSLLHDLVDGAPDIHAVLVHDISRWGRFQDIDESAHYEFICKTLGAPVHYCAEPFANDHAISTFILKSLKRSIAAEYSRELSVKCFNGQRHLAELGFHVGSMAGYGLRRMAVSADGCRTQLLQAGEYKSLTSDHIVLVPGPQKEVDVVKMIFAMASDKESTYRGIASELNGRGIPYKPGRHWRDYAIESIVKNKKYAGSNIWNQHTGKLGSPQRPTPSEQWVTVANAFTALVDTEAFNRAQRVRPNGRRWTIDQVRETAEQLQNGLGTLPRNGPTLITLRRRLAELPYFRSRRGTTLDPKGGAGSTRKDLVILRNKIFDRLHQLFPTKLSEFHLPRKSRPILRLDNGTIVSVLVCGRVLRKTGIMRWMLQPVRAESTFVTLICLNAPDRIRYFLVPRINRPPSCCCISTNHSLFRTGIGLNDLAQFYEATKAF